MQITKTISDDALTIAITGRIDTLTAPQLDAEIQGKLDGIKNLTIDLKNVEYISSAGLRIFLTAQKIMNKQGSMVIKNVDDTVNDIFEVTGFSEILTVE